MAQPVAHGTAPNQSAQEQKSIRKQLQKQARAAGGAELEPKLTQSE